MHGSAPPLLRPRPSAGDRERAARRLRDACEDERLSLDTFAAANPTVSARHAVLSHADGSWSIRDLGSTNGTFVNGWRVVDEVEVRPGDVVTLGGQAFVAAPPLPARATGSGGRGMNAGA